MTVYNCPEHGISHGDYCTQCYGQPVVTPVAHDMMKEVVPEGKTDGTELTGHALKVLIDMATDNERKRCIDLVLTCPLDADNPASYREQIVAKIEKGEHGEG